MKRGRGLATKVVWNVWNVLCRLIVESKRAGRGGYSRRRLRTRLPYGTCSLYLRWKSPLPETRIRSNERGRRLGGQRDGGKFRRDWTRGLAER